MNDRPSLNNLILGITYDDQIVTESLKSLTHIAIAGVTRFGKSIFIQQLLYQIVTARENIMLYLADLGGTTFVDFGLPYASTLPETEAMIYKVMREAERRKILYEATGRGIRSLDIYNEVTGDNLPWIV
jgi:DNA segregation ATPase FtsK/SpoIIIE-like protein